MGVDCRIQLPHTARLRDVAQVIGILAGHKVTTEEYPTVVGIRFSTYNEMPECCRILFEHEGEPRQVLYHFEFNSGNRGMLPRSTPFNIALGRALVDFFGGTLDYQDCDDVSEDYRVPARTDINAEDGEPWEQLQRRKFALQPLTAEDIAACAEFAAYQ